MSTDEPARPRSKRPLVIALIALSLTLGALLAVPLPRTVKSSYVLTPAGTLTLIAQRDGVIGEVNFQSGAAVTKGALVARYDVTALEQNLPVLEQQLAILEKREPGKPNYKARAALAKLQKALKAADAALEKARKSANGKRTPALLAAEKQQRTAAAAVTRATPPFGTGLTRRELDKKMTETRDAIANARAAIASADIIAPASGVITLVALEPGRSVVSDEQLATVVDTSKLKAVMKLPTGQAVLKGMPVVLALPSGGTRQATLLADARDDVAEAELDNAKGELTAGAQGDADIESEAPLLSR